MTGVVLVGKLAVIGGTIGHAVDEDGLAAHQLAVAFEVIGTAVQLLHPHQCGLRVRAEIVDVSAVFLPAGLDAAVYTIIIGDRPVSKRAYAHCLGAAVRVELVPVSVQRLFAGQLSGVAVRIIAVTGRTPPSRRPVLL